MEIEVPAKKPPEKILGGLRYRKKILKFDLTLSKDR